MRILDTIKNWFKKSEKGSGAGSVIEIKTAIPEGMHLDQLKKAAIEQMTGEVYFVSDKFIPPKIQDYKQVNFTVGGHDRGDKTGVYCVGGGGGCLNENQQIIIGPGGGVPGDCHSATGGNGNESYTTKFIKG